MNESLNQRMNDKAVYRTAPATKGLLTILGYQNPPFSLEDKIVIHVGTQECKTLCLQTLSMEKLSVLLCSGKRCTGVPLLTLFSGYYTANYKFTTVHYTIYTAHCTANCTLHTAHCIESEWPLGILSTVCYYFVQACSGKTSNTTK